jgi:glucosamine-6-phosphate deaminase
MRLFVEDDYVALCDATAKYLIDRINEAKAAGKPYVMALPAGRTVSGIYERLVAAFKGEGGEGGAAGASRVDFDHVVTFNIDEYVGVPRDSEHSQHSFMWKHFFRHVNVRRENVHFLDGATVASEDWAAECER